MTLEQILGETGKQLETYHQNTGTSIDFRAYISEEQNVYTVSVASVQGTYEFRDSSVFSAWLGGLNNGIDPITSAHLMMQAEAVAKQKIMLEAQEVALAKEIAELPETQGLKDAAAAAQAIISDADVKLAKLAEAKELLQAEANVKADELAQEVAKATAEELAKAEELISAEKEKG